MRWSLVARAEDTRSPRASLAHMLPTFLVIGAQKCGTTSLYHYLDAHPDVYMSRLKEPHFFAWEGRDFDLAGPNAADGAWQLVSSLEDYEALFAPGANHAARGEASSGYLQAPHAAEAMRRHAPNLRLVAIFRNPIRRAHSAFLHARRQGIEPLADFEAALNAEPQRRRDDWTGLVHYTSAGMYATALDPYLAQFPASQVRLYLNDDLQRDPVTLMQDLYGFIGVEPTVVPPVETRHNAGRAVRSPALDLFVRRTGLADLIRRAVPGSVARRVYGTLNERTPEPLPDHVAGRLARQFAPEVARLSRMLGRDLSGWFDGSGVPPPADGMLGRTPLEGPATSGPW